MKQYIALLRGINVGGHHKVPMSELKKELEKIGFKNIITLLNSGNVIFDAQESSPQKLETEITQHLEKVFQFSIPVLVRTAEDIKKLIKENPFSNIETTKETRLYITYFKEKPVNEIIPPWKSEDHSFQIINVKNKMTYSILDISQCKTPKAMGVLEKMFGKDITTRNWNTIKKIGGKLN